ncbi:DUF6286 domain-containing protein [Streptomyces sp. NPDC004126]|uniref:DUF6286 domain-containing protein n=1 Tax=Streptomyces sp. NPDC004126 TaxID=3390695 RepID=UPI003CFCE5A7
MHGDGRARGRHRHRAPALHPHPSRRRRPGPEAAVNAPHRFRSPRRVPAAITALVVLAVAGLFLYDLAAVRAHRPGMRWRRELGALLERYTPAGALLVLAGAGLLLLALTPGLRGVLPMRTESGVRAGIGRRAAALVLRDRAMEVAGVRSVRVRVGRTRVGVRATSHFRELDDVRADLDQVLAVGIGELGLAHPPRTRIRLRR